MSGKWYTTATINIPKRKKDATSGRIYFFVALRDFRGTQNGAVSRSGEFTLDEVAILIHAAICVME
jgi:hypothetical protein